MTPTKHVTTARRAPAAAKTADLEPQLVEAFVKGGMTEAQAKIAAAGRHATRSASNLFLAAREGGLSPAAARTFARGRSGIVEVVKNVAGLPASCFAWVPDPEDPTTWKMQIARSTGTDWSPDEDLVRAAVAVLPGIAPFDKALDIPTSDLPAVKAALRAAWIACGAPIDEMPAELQQEALRREFMRGGLSEQAAAIAARGRRR
jgi:hypothetical protein